jgi:protein-S-isoprenylcysteine O-methyltransferase Ste14
MSEAVLTRARILPPKGLLIALASQLPLIVTTGLQPKPVEIVSGAMLIAIGGVLNVWSERLFVRAGVNVCPFTPAPVLVDRGPYRLTRNPMYAGLIALNLGAALMTGVLANVWSSIAYAIWLHFAFVLPEEASLRAELGAAFDYYSARVARWLF